MTTPFKQDSTNNVRKLKVSERKQKEMLLKGWKGGGGKREAESKDSRAL